MILKFALALAVFALTLYLVTARPKGLQIGFGAMIGAALALLAGITPLRDVATVWGIVWDSTFTFVAIVVMSLVFDEAGFFEHISKRVEAMTHGSTRKLFTYNILLGAAVSALFSNDGGALVLTPIIYSVIRRTDIPAHRYLAFIMSTQFITDTASIPFVISNLVNIIGSTYFSITFLQYFLHMFLPFATSVLSSLAMLYLVLGRGLPERFHYTPPADTYKDERVIALAIPFMASLIAVYFATSFLNVPVAFIAVPAVAGLAGYAAARGRISVSRILREAPWQIIVFSLGMFIVVYGLGNSGMTQYLAYALSRIQATGPVASTVLSGYMFAGMAGLMNNLPSVLLGNLAIARLHDPGILPYVNVIANDIGPKFTPIGSLATLLWMYTLERKSGMRVSALYYMKIGTVTALPVLTLTLLSSYLASLL
ncbi:arsenical efflux pump membrane protein ArsB [Thermogymnomonas acidicola]|uniref:arsenical efflux pump membrane protein ArsB n=1 Tax=Thermogymnomonas acidicola TaxID=399579 RepID=UPI001E60786D|nr:arsenical efflux pump membrane protein ArsB [Thermogymnomonas acidicola]